MQSTRTEFNQLEMSTGVRLSFEIKEPSDKKVNNSQPTDYSTTSTDLESPQRNKALGVSYVNQMKKHEFYAKAIEKIRLFPLLRDIQLQNLPLNYFLYLEFLHMSIRTFTALLIYTLLIMLIYFPLLEFVPSLQEQFPLFVAVAAYLISSGFFLRIFRERQEKKLVENNIMNNIPWSEDHFSLLLEGFPKETTKREIIAYLNDILLQQNNKGSVKHIILLQDYHEYALIKQKIRKIDKELEALRKNTSKEKYKLELLNNKSKLAGLLGQLEVEIIHFQNFKGKALIIFDTILSKVTIQNYFTNRSILGRWTKIRRFYYKDQRLKVSTLPEPQDLVFENIHYSTAYRSFLKILAYCISLGIAG